MGGRKRKKDEEKEHRLRSADHKKRNRSSSLTSVLNPHKKKVEVEEKPKGANKAVVTRQAERHLRPDVGMGGRKRKKDEEKKVGVEEKPKGANKAVVTRQAERHLRPDVGMEGVGEDDRELPTRAPIPLMFHHLAVEMLREFSKEAARKHKIFTDYYMDEAWCSKALPNLLEPASLALAANSTPYAWHGADCTERDFLDVSKDILNATFPFKFLQSPKKLKLPVVLPTEVREKHLNLIGTIQVDAVHAMLMTPMALIDFRKGSNLVMLDLCPQLNKLSFMSRSRMGIAGKAVHNHVHWKIGECGAKMQIYIVFPYTKKSGNHLRETILKFHEHIVIPTLTSMQQQGSSEFHFCRKREGVSIAAHKESWSKMYSPGCVSIGFLRMLGQTIHEMNIAGDAELRRWIPRFYVSMVGPKHMVYGWDGLKDFLQSVYRHVNPLLCGKFVIDLRLVITPTSSSDEKYHAFWNIPFVREVLQNAEKYAHLWPTDAELAGEAEFREAWEQRPHPEMDDESFGTEELADGRVPSSVRKKMQAVLDSRELEGPEGENAGEDGLTEKEIAMAKEILHGEDGSWAGKEITVDEEELELLGATLEEDQEEEEAADGFMRAMQRAERAAEANAAVPIAPLVPQTGGGGKKEEKEKSKEKKKEKNKRKKEAEEEEEDEEEEREEVRNKNESEDVFSFTVDAVQEKEEKKKAKISSWNIKEALRDRKEEGEEEERETHIPHNSMNKEQYFPYLMPAVNGWTGSYTARSSLLSAVAYSDSSRSHRLPFHPHSNLTSAVSLLPIATLDLKYNNNFYKGEREKLGKAALTAAQCEDYYRAVSSFRAMASVNEGAVLELRINKAGNITNVKRWFIFLLRLAEASTVAMYREEDTEDGKFSQHSLDSLPLVIFPAQRWMDLVSAFYSAQWSLISPAIRQASEIDLRGRAWNLCGPLQTCPVDFHVILYMLVIEANLHLMFSGWARYPIVQKLMEWMELAQKAKEVGHPFLDPEQFTFGKEGSVGHLNVYGEWFIDGVMSKFDNGVDFATELYQQVVTALHWLLPDRNHEQVRDMMVDLKSTYKSRSLDQWAKDLHVIRSQYIAGKVEDLSRLQIKMRDGTNIRTTAASELIIMMSGAARDTKLSWAELDELMLGWGLENFNTKTAQREAHLWLSAFYVAGNNWRKQGHKQFFHTHSQRTQVIIDKALECNLLVEVQQEDSNEVHYRLGGSEDLLRIKSELSKAGYMQDGRITDRAQRRLKRAAKEE